ncbi:hypothetical protein [Paraburkholderia hayleyella]|uniref:hypothetical protein n=1 Tax=Paraburkholderia hayleyella TaxID=2152889 RepID=UPI0012911006|nr:hypothetical protein [Paraburkholderia hayleyella]
MTALIDHTRSARLDTERHTSMVKTCRDDVKKRERPTTPNARKMYDYMCGTLSSSDNDQDDVDGDVDVATLNPDAQTDTNAYVPEQPAREKPTPEQHGSGSPAAGHDAFTAPAPTDDYTAAPPAHDDQRLTFTLRPANSLPYLGDFNMAISVAQMEISGMDVQQTALLQLKFGADLSSYSAKLIQAAITMLQNSIEAKNIGSDSAYETLTSLGDWQSFGSGPNGGTFAWPNNTFIYWYQRTGQSGDPSTPISPAVSDSVISMMFLQSVLGLPGSNAPDIGESWSKPKMPNGNDNPDIKTWSYIYTVPVGTIKTWTTTLQSRMSTLTTNNSQAMNNMENATSQYQTAVSTAAQNLQKMIDMLMSLISKL